MSYPDFPEEFIREACPRVEHYRRRGDENPEDWAECNFEKAGLGLMCQSCKLHLTRPFIHYEKDRKWLTVLEKYYNDCEKADEEWRNARLNVGGYI